VVTDPTTFEGLSHEHQALVGDVVGELNAYVFVVQRRFSGARATADVACETAS
jgi:hypothetical protein